MTGNIAILWPMIVQAALTLAVYGVLAVRRKAAADRGDAKFEVMANGGGEPDRSKVVARNLSNQYELPVLFFAVCLSLYVTNGASWLAVVLAWVFALSRIVHAAVHLGPNILPLRGAVFGVGYLCVAALWIILAIHLL